MHQFVISPSDLTFLYQCKGCFYDKYVLKESRPRHSLPGIFTQIDTLMTACYDNQPTTKISKDLPPGIITLGGTFVKSKPLICKEQNCELILSGKVDSLFKFDDGTLGIPDFKTTIPYKGKLDFYFNQLMSYVVCIEHNDPNVNKNYKVSLMGLVCFEPKVFAHNDAGAQFSGDVQWIPIEKDTNKFKNFLKEIAILLTGQRPILDRNCKFCHYKNLSDCAAI